MSEEVPDNVLYLPTPSKLTPGQQEYWEDRLRIAEHAVEVAKHMLDVSNLVEMPPVQRIAPVIELTPPLQS